MKTDRPAMAGGTPVREELLGYGGQSIGEAEKAAVVEALDGDYITRGPTVEAFETEVANLLGVKHAVATSSGTAALHIAGAALGFDSGDEVITTPLTFAATAYTACYTGATPVFADIEPDTRTLDPDAVREAVTENTVGLVPMHYAGHPCDIDTLLEVADEYGLKIVWDACHAFGSRYRGEIVGGERDASVFSFHPVKNITTGEGGMVVTNNSDIAERARSFRSFRMNTDPKGHADEPWYQVVEGVGFNYHMTDLQAALGRAQLGRRERFKQRRSEIVARYNEAFGDTNGIQTPISKETADPFWHLYAVGLNPEFGCSRQEFVQAMHAENIGVQVHYVPLHYHPYFQSEYGYERGQFPITESVYDGLVSLPLTPAMSDDDVEDVIRAVERVHHYCRRGGSNSVADERGVASEADHE